MALPASAVVVVAAGEAPVAPEVAVVAGAAVDADEQFLRLR